MTRASKAMNAQFSLGLTGTPIENTVADLWCMMDTLLPGEFGSRNEFLALYGANANETALHDLGQKLVGCADSKYTQRRWLDKLTVCQKKLYSV